jgi:hypothetical protein
LLLEVVVVAAEIRHMVVTAAGLQELPAAMVRHGQASAELKRLVVRAAPRALMVARARLSWAAPAVMGQIRQAQVVEAVTGVAVAVPKTVRERVVVAAGI